MERRGDFGGPSRERDFDFVGFSTRDSEESSESGSDGGTEVDSDVENAIMAELYFHDPKPNPKRAGKKRVSVAKQLGSREVRLDQSSTGSVTSISFVMDSPRKRERKQEVPSELAAGAGAAVVSWEGAGQGEGLGPGMGEEGEGGGPSESTKKKKYHLNRSSTGTTGRGEMKRKFKWKGKSPMHDGESGEGVLGEGEGGGRGRRDYVGVRQMEKWAGSSSGSDEEEDSRHSSDMELSDDATDTVGQLYLQVDEKDKWHIVLKDVMGRDAYEREYGGRVLGGGRTGKCFNCKQRGQHQSNNCPHPIRHQVCYICSAYDHICSRCPHDFCTYCYQRKHRGKPCSAPWGKHTVCPRCYCNGHNELMCHEQWRQYHNTTSIPGNQDGGSGGGGGGLVRIEPSRQRQGKRVFCFNCGRRGHFGHECSRSRPRWCPHPLTPYIATYVDIPENRKRKRGGKREPHYQQGLLRQTPATPAVNANSPRGDGLLVTPPHPLPSLPRGKDKDSSNGHWRRHSADGSRQPPQTERRRDSDSFVHRQQANLGFSKSSSGSSYPHRQPFPPPPPPPHLLTPPTRSGFSNDDVCCITFIQSPPQPPPPPPPPPLFPARSLSEHQPLRRGFSQEQRSSHDPLPGGLRHEDNFPRTPFPTPHGHLRDDHHLDSRLGPPPGKISRRDSEPFDRRGASRSLYDHYPHELAGSERFDRERSRHGQRRESSFLNQDQKRRNSGSGFRGSPRAVSLMDSHRRNSYSHHEGRTPHSAHR